MKIKLDLFKSSKKKSLIILAVVMIITIYKFFSLSNFSLISSNENTYESFLTESKLNDNNKQQAKLSDLDECDWIYVEPRAYFKRQSSFYFPDVSLIVLSYITMNRFAHHKFDIEVNVNGDQTYKLYLKDTQNFRVKVDPFDGTFIYFKLIARFDLRWLQEKGIQFDHTKNNSIYITRKFR